MNKENKRKLNKNNAYLLFVTALALVYVVAFSYENYCKNKMIKSYEHEIELLENKTVYLEDEGRDVNIDELHNLYKSLKEEYNDLYVSGQ